MAEAANLRLITFRVGPETFVLDIMAVRQIVPYSGSTSIPTAPAFIEGIVVLRNEVIPIIDLAHKLGMKSTEANERSAIVVAEVHSMVVGLVVDRVSDILTIGADQIQPVPEVTTSFDKVYAEGIIAHENGMICFLNLSRMFKERDIEDLAA